MVGILHLPDDTVVLAPTYDQVPLRHQNTDGRLALAIGGEYIHANLTLEKMAEELVSWQYSGFSTTGEAVSFITNRLEAYGRVLDKALPSKKSYPGLKADIASFISNLLSNKRVGT